MTFKSKAGLLARDIALKLHKEGFIAYFAGGCVRDLLLGKEPEDFDIATTATPDAVEKLFKKTIPVGRQFGVMLVVIDEIQFEVATFRCEGGYQDGRHPTRVTFSAPEEDAKRRDFTVNGLFFDPAGNKVLDYVQGESDIRAQCLRAIGNPDERFEEDKLRLLRAVRLAANLNFTIETNTWKSICSNAHKINQVSPERIRDELVKMLTRPNAAKGIRLMSESGLLKEILPEVEAMKGVEQHPVYHPEGDVFVHTCLLLEKLEKPSLILALGALFHDIAKPVTFTKTEDGHIHFYEHEHAGIEMTKLIMKRLRFSNEEIEQVSECVGKHMVFASVQKMREGKLKRFVTRPTFPDELEMHRIDCLSSHGLLDNYHFLNQKLEEYKKEDLKPKPLINGHDLIGLGVKPGPKMKPFLEEIYELQLEGVLSSRESALTWVRDNLKKVQ